MIKVYGIKNCDTMKKTFRWLDDHDVAYEFHDYKKQGIDPSTLENWLGQIGWEILVNRRGTTWRKLPDEQKSSMDETLAKQVMQDNPSIIKRPLIDSGNGLIVGFSESELSQLA